MRSHLTKCIAAAATAAGLATAAVAAWQDAAPAQAPPGAETPAEREVMTRVEEFARAYEAGDARALTALFADDAVIVTPDGQEMRGKEAIGRMYADSFADGGGLKLDARVEAVRFLTPDVARVEGRSRVVSPDGAVGDDLRFNALIVRKGDAWSIAEIRERPAPAEPVEPSQRLAGLEWMIGEWVGEGDRHKVAAKVDWAEGRGFLIRTHAIEVDGRPRVSATMFIGWDPQAEQIKSWLFDSQGGRGEGVWTRAGERRWVVKTTGVLPDGLASSSTMIHTILDDDSVRTDVIDRIVGGRIEGDVADLILVRKPPEPVGDASPRDRGVE